MNDIDIWRSAAQLLEQYPDEADLVAARRADALLEQGDSEGFHVWKRITDAVDVLRREKPREGEAVN